jgi:hypothetical protein
VSRPCIPYAADTDTVLWLPFRASDVSPLTTDHSGDGQTVATAKASGTDPELAAGYHGAGCRFDAEGGTTIKRLEVATGGTLDIAGSITLEVRVYVEAGTGTHVPILYRMDHTGSLNNVFRLWVQSADDCLAFAVYDSAQTLAQIQTAETFPKDRWVDIRAVFDAGSDLYLFVDG